MKKSQVWSFDVILAIIMLIVAFFIFYFLLKPQTENKFQDLKKEAALVAGEVLPNITISGTEQIDEDKLRILLEEAYPELKKKFRSGADFCIYFEDEQGNVVYIRPGVTGLGSSEINVSGVPCNSSYNPT